VRFANGEAVQSRDVLATLALLKNPLYEYPYLADLDFIEKVVAVDPLNFSIKLKEKFAPWKNYLTFKILQAGDIEGLDAAAFRKHRPVGCGPYQLASVTEPRAVLLKQNPYYGKRRAFKKIAYAVLGDSRQGPLKLLNDEMDAVEVQADEVQAYGRLGEWRQSFSLVKYKKFGYTYLVFNLKNSSIELNLRRLFYNRLQASPFLQIFLQGAGETVHSPFLG